MHSLANQFLALIAIFLAIPTTVINGPPKPSKMSVPNCDDISKSIEKITTSFGPSNKIYRILPKRHYRIRITIGSIKKPTKQVIFVTDEKGKITWSFKNDVLENKFVPKGFKNQKSNEEATILVESMKDKRFLVKYANYAQMKKKMVEQKGKLYKKNIIYFEKLESAKKTVKWGKKLEDFRHFTKDAKDDWEGITIVKEDNADYDEEEEEEYEQEEQNKNDEDEEEMDELDRLQNILSNAKIR